MTLEEFFQTYINDFVEKDPITREPLRSEILGLMMLAYSVGEDEKIIREELD